MALYPKAGKQMIFDLINAANPSDIPYSETNSAIEAITNGSFTIDGKQYNTSARLRGLMGSGYTGSKTVYYNRISLATLFLNATFRLDSFSAASVYDALPVINSRYGLNLTQADVVDAVLNAPNQANYNSIVGVRGKPTSPLLTTASATLYYYRGLPYLDKFVLSRNLNAYNHPVADSSRLSAQMLTIGLDFTEYKNYLTVDGTGMPQFSDLSHLMTSQFGLPYWDAPLNSNYVVDQPTSAVADANKAFDRVVVQSGIDNGVVTGVAYYHYMN